MVNKHFWDFNFFVFRDSLVIFMILSETWVWIALLHPVYFMNVYRIPWRDFQCFSHSRDFQCFCILKRLREPSCNHQTLHTIGKDTKQEKSTQKQKTSIKMAWNKIIIVCLLLTAIIANVNCVPIDGKLFALIF